MFIIAVAMTVIFFIGGVYYFLSAAPKVRETIKAKNAEEEIAKLNQRLTSLAASASVDEKVALANECVKLGLHKEAIPLYINCLNSGESSNPHIRFALAKALHGNQAYKEARNILIQLQGDRTAYKPNQIRFLNAKNSEALGELDNARYEYAQLADILIGEEARFRHGALLKKMGKTAEANEIFKLILERAHHAHPDYCDEQKEWIKLAKENISK